MKLIRWGSPGREQLAVLGDDNHAIDVQDFVQAGTPSWLAPARLQAIAGAAAERRATVDLSEVRIGSPIPQPGKVVCVGMNYAAHIAEVGMETPAEPTLFLKAGDTVVGPYDQVSIPPNSKKTDYEVELAVVIGGLAAYLSSPSESAAVIAGFTISNDVSEREFQLERGGQWDKGKNCPTFNPLGPWLVTPDEIQDIQALRLRSFVNGGARQDSTTTDMVYGVDYLVWYVSQFMTLYPGDVINTGTPAGVGMGFDPPRYLEHGDTVAVSIDGLGQQQQQFKRGVPSAGVRMVG
jgi:2-keto-4-pentenoate hydratase/2-oxohepta-3-ene-1,7-dioic acid hydratase in catechol pathway